MLRKCERIARDTLRALLGPPETWGIASRARRLAADLPARLNDALAKTSRGAPDALEQPVFVFSAGWRSGSTLLQRMIMEHNEDILLWGEPFAHAAIADRLLDQFRAFTPEWPPQAYFLSGLATHSISDTWTANLYPDVDDLFEAHRAFFRALYGASASRAGRKTWGFKVVRLTIDHAAYFRLLFPRCRIIFLYRNPYDAYLSYRNLDSGWFLRWPNRAASTPYAFGRCWAELTRGYLEGHRKVDGLLIRYEDLDDPQAVARLEAYLGWTVPRPSDMRRIAMPDSYRPPRQLVRSRLPTADRALLRLATARVLRAAGYA